MEFDLNFADLHKTDAPRNFGFQKNIKGIQPIQISRLQENHDATSVEQNTESPGVSNNG